METVRLQEQHLKSRIEQDCNDLIRTNVELRNQLIELKENSKKEFELLEEHKAKNIDQINEEETIRSDLTRYKDDLYMMKVTMEMKEKEMSELTQRLKLADTSNNKCNIGIPLNFSIGGKSSSLREIFSGRNKN